MQPPQNGLITRFLDEQQLPASFSTLIADWYLPLARKLVSMAADRDRPLIVGINGAQGTGKSTLARFLSLMLTQQRLRVATLSLDDFYLDRARRGQLGRTVHPLLATRGVPGTHDLDQAKQLMAALADPDSRGQALLPRFDKAVDEPKPRAQWESIELPVDVVLLEGWFVGLQPQHEELLGAPVNALEIDEDPDGTWRSYVNNRLADYQPLFQTIDYLVMLKAPSFECVYRWRSLQEQKLAATSGSAGDRVMDSPALDRFIQHFERLTRHCLETLPAQANLVLALNADHEITHSQPAMH
jgi:D-glycerate 3-kinase